MYNLILWNNFLIKKIQQYPVNNTYNIKFLVNSIRIQNAEQIVLKDFNEVPNIMSLQFKVSTVFPLK